MAKARTGAVLLALLFATGFCGQSMFGEANSGQEKGSPPSASGASGGDNPPVDLTPDASGVVPAAQIRELLLRAEQNDIENDKRQRDYTYMEREERRHLDHHGELKKVESETSEVLEIYGEQVQRLTAKNDQPLPADEAKKEEEKIQKIIDKRKNESEDDRRKRLAKDEKAREEDRKFVLEVADAFNFRLLGSAQLEGRDTWLLEGEPRPGFQPKERESRILSKFKGRVWIDKRQAQWVKLDITAIDTISVGLVLARIHQGTHLVVELTQVNGEVWLPKQVQVHLDARVALFKSYDEDVAQTYSDYRKFRTDTRMTVVGEQP